MRKRSAAALSVLTTLISMGFMGGTVAAQGSGDAAIEYEVLADSDEVADVTSVDVAPDGRVFFTEISGNVRVLNVRDGSITTLGVLPTSSWLCATCPEPNVWEAGVHGIILARDFSKTGNFFVSYALANSHCDVPSNIKGEPESVPGAGCYRLSRFTLAAEQTAIDMASEKVLLTWPFSRFPPGSTFRPSAHHGGGIDMLPDGTIVVSVGDNTNPESSSGYGPRDRRPDHWYENSERTAQNPKDRRGKLLRVNPDGSVPSNNPYVDKPGYDPYIYAMGFRNPYRAAVDPDTGTVYSGQVGPDASEDDPARGPQGVEELNVLPYAKPFNGGWPRCIGPGRPYIKWDYASNTSKHEPLDCSRYQKPVLWYGDDGSKRWPKFGTGGDTIQPVVVYKYHGDGPLKLPSAFQNKVLMFDWTRSWATTIPVRSDGSLNVATKRVKIVLKDLQGPVDASIGPDGAIYVAEFGTNYFSNSNSRIGRIICKGCDRQNARYADGASTGSSAALPPFGRVWVLLAGLMLASPWIARRRRLA